MSLMIEKISHNNQELHFVNNESKRVIVFSHGFGVQWDARGMFVEIAENLSNEFDYVFFNYNETVDGSVYIEELKEQEEVFKNVMNYVQTKPYEEINIITHSFGAIVPLKLNPNNINHAIFIAPPTEVDRDKQLELLKRRPGSEFNPHGYSTFTRSDGSKTYVNISFYNSLIDLKAVDLFNNSKANQKNIIMALEDEIVSNEMLDVVELKRDVVVTKIHGNHNFTEENREILIEEIKRILELSV
jgi:hypothetical protein